MNKKKRKALISSQGKKKKLKELKNTSNSLRLSQAKNYNFYRSHFLREMLKGKDGVGLEFFQSYSFDRDVISKIAVDCFKSCLIDDLKETLLKTRFSFSIDAVSKSPSREYADFYQSFSQLFYFSTKKKEVKSHAKRKWIQNFGIIEISIKTRWLSLGNSLRLVEIWLSL